MQRLTDINAEYYTPDMWTNVSKLSFYAVRLQETMARLKLYEDIIYAPDGSERITLDRLAELVTAEVEGMAVVLPCQVGTTIYTTRWWDNVEEKCTDSHGKPFYRTRMKHKITKESYHPFGLDFSEWCKTVFLTRTEAEQALARAEAEAKGEQK